MQEILTAATYLIVWLVCWRLFGIESGLIKLSISLGMAILVFLLLSFRRRPRRKDRGGHDGTAS